MSLVDISEWLTVVTVFVLLQLNSFNHYIEREVKRLAYINERWNIHENERYRQKPTRKPTSLQPMLLIEEEYLTKNAALYKAYLTKETAVLQKMGLAKDQEMQEQQQQQQQHQQEHQEEETEATNE
uniref:Uncharacterized protein n=1 Tax=Octopus bimaculoides TaxID=37653 RepID=A0A0L8GB21_OCTBM